MRAGLTGSMLKVVSGLLLFCSVCAGGKYVKAPLRMSPETEKLMLELLQKDKGADAVRAAFALGQAGRRNPEVVKVLQSLAGDKFPALRAAAVFALGQSRVPAALPGLLQAVKDENWQVRVEALLALGKFPSSQDSCDVVLSGLKDEDAAVRQAALQCLGLIARAESAKAITDYYKKEKSPRLQSLALAVFSARKLPVRYDFLKSCFGSDYSAVRSSALRVAGISGKKESRGEVIKLLRDKTPEVRREAVLTLGKISDNLPDVLGEMVSDSDQTVRKNTVVALGGFAVELSIKLLASMSEDSFRQVRRAASMSLVKIARQNEQLRAKVLSQALAMSKAEAKVVRIEALYLVGKLKDSASVKKIAASWSSQADNSELRLLIWGIGQSKAISLVDKVISAIKDKDSGLRLHGSVAVGLLQYAPAVNEIGKILRKTVLLPGSIEKTYAYLDAPRVALLQSLGQIGNQDAQSVIAERAGATDVIEDDKSFKVLARIIEDKKITQAETGLRKVFANKMVSIARKYEIVKLLRKLLGKDPGLALPDAKPQRYDSFFIEAIRR